MLPGHRIVISGDAVPTRTAFVLHGILGSLRNWRTMARRIVERWPSWRLVLVDLRNHGDSTGAEPPHSLDACAHDLHELAEFLGDPPELVMGHSFGGKVALAYGRAYPDELAQLWVLDSSPGPVSLSAGLSSDVVRVIDALVGVAMPLAARSDIIGILTEQGLSRGLAQWMTTNLHREDDGFHWRFDLPAVQQMLADYAAVDLVPWIDDTVIDVHFVWAGKGERDTPELRARFAFATTVTHHVLPDSGHWVHVDDPDGLLDVLDAGFG